MIKGVEAEVASTLSPKRRGKTEKQVTALLSPPAELAGKLVGKIGRAGREYFTRIAASSHFDIDEESIARLQSLAQEGHPIIVAANHQHIDPERYPRAHYQYNLGVDAFLIEHVFKEAGINLHFLAQYTKNHDHPRALRRVKSYIGDAVRKGLYREWGFIPVDKTVDYGETIQEGQTPRSRNLLEVTHEMEDHILSGASIGFFVQKPTDTAHVEETLWPGASYYSNQFGVRLLPVFIDGAFHLDPLRTVAAPVKLRVGEAIEPTGNGKNKQERRLLFDMTMERVRDQLLHLRQQAGRTPEPRNLLAKQYFT